MLIYNQLFVEENPKTKKLVNFTNFKFSVN